MGSAPATVGEIRRAQRADGPAAVLGIGTANPPTCVAQDDYPDYYFRVTSSEHLTDLKAKLTRICKQPTMKLVSFHFASCSFRLLEQKSSQ
jgi:hypothetical protein